MGGRAQLLVMASLHLCARRCASLPAVFTVPSPRQSKLHLFWLHAALQVLRAALPRAVVDDDIASRRPHRAVRVGRPLDAEVNRGSHHASNPHDVSRHGEVTTAARHDAEWFHRVDGGLIVRVHSVQVLVCVDATVPLGVLASLAVERMLRVGLPLEPALAEEVCVAVVRRPAVRQAAEHPAVARSLRILRGVRGAGIAALARRLDVVATAVHHRVALWVAMRLLATHRRRRDAGAVGEAGLDGLGRLALVIAAARRRSCLGGDGRGGRGGRGGGATASIALEGMLTQGPLPREELREEERPIALVGVHGDTVAHAAQQLVVTPDEIVLVGVGAHQDARGHPDAGPDGCGHVAAGRGVDGREDGLEVG
mmetsp:Transcript_19666/g.58577  ORF Transcript_19666/g.58577 Transcript_19666/m.58577 type:complete len:368 (-) Transcript_19666:462-1565(-)